MKPLAYQMRPESFDDIFGQDHLVGNSGIITKMLKTNSFCDIINGNLNWKTGKEVLWNSMRNCKN